MSLFYLTRLFIASGSILLPSELFQFVKFKFIHKISVIQEKFHVFFNLLQGPDITRLGAGSGLRVEHPRARDKG